MKKLYTTIATVAICAMAAQAGIVTRNLVPSTMATDLAARGTLERTVSMLPKASTPAKAQTLAYEDQTWKLVGTGTFDDMIFTDSSYEVTIEESEQTPGLYRIPDAWSEISADPKPLYIDATNPDMVIVPEQETGVFYSYYNSNVTLFSYSALLIDAGFTAEEIVENYPAVVIKKENSIINFPSRSLLMLFADNEEEPDPYYANSDEMNLLFPGATPKWSSIGTGKMFDGMVCTMFFDDTETDPEGGFDPTWADVVIEKNNYEEGVYRINDPWACFVAMGFSLPALEINIANPQCVMIDLQSIGVTVGERGVTCIMSDSWLAMEGVANPATLEEYLADPESMIITYDADTRTVNMLTHEVTLSNGTKKECAPILYNWPNWSGNGGQCYVNTYAVNSYIVFPEEGGVQGVVVDNDEAAPVVYYNLQGVRVDNPTAGLYIMRQGNKATKVLVR